MDPGRLANLSRRDAVRVRLDRIRPVRADPRDVAAPPEARSGRHGAGGWPQPSAFRFPSQQGCSRAAAARSGLGTGSPPHASGPNPWTRANGSAPGPIQEPFLVVARSGPTVALFAIMMTTMYHNKEDYRENIRKHAGRSSSIAKMALMGFNTLIPFICFSWALNHISSATGGVLMTMTPIFALLFSQIPWLRVRARLPMTTTLVHPLTRSTRPPAVDQGKNHSPLTSIKLTGMFISVLGVVCMFLDEFYKRDASPDVVPGFFVYLIGICSSASLGRAWRRWPRRPRCPGPSLTATTLLHLAQ